MPDTPSALPSAARQRLEQLQNSGAPDAPPAAPDAPPPAAPDAPPAAPPEDTAQVERVTLSREEVNELRALAGASKTLESRLEESEGRNEALMQRLTELERSNKGSPDGPNSLPAAPPSDPPAPIASLPQAEFTPEEDEQFGESREYISKVAQNVFATLMAPILAKIENNLGELKTTTVSTSRTLEQQQQDRFNSTLKKLVPNFRELIRHQHWGRFLDEVDDLSGYTMERILGGHIQSRNAEKAANIYKRFADKYVSPAPADDTGEYAGALPGAGAAEVPQDPNAPKPKLKLSDRKKASRDYVNKKITFEQLQEINKKFEEAEKAGNVDYNS